MLSCSQGRGEQVVQFVARLQQLTLSNPTLCVLHHEHSMKKVLQPADTGNNEDTDIYLNIQASI